MEIKFSQKNYSARLQKLLQKEEVKAYTMAILTFFALSFFTIFAIKPTVATLFKLKKQIADARQVDKKLEEKINLLLKAQETLQQQEENLSLIEEALPPEAQFTQLIRKIESLANEEGVALSALQVEGFGLYEGSLTSEEKPLRLDSFIFSLAVAGEYPQAEAFLYKLLNLRRVITLENLQIESKEKEVNLNLKAKAYYLKKT